ncbi:asparagine synthetase A [Erysipelotrichaceae bacterium]|nr:asparagine synthetase A [Erysipelotrichaceae bacterium]
MKKTEHCIIPEGYIASLNVRETEVAIKILKDFFQIELAKSLNLSRVSAPLFVQPETGLNDNLAGTETPVNFHAPFVHKTELEIVHSLAKWKRMALYKYDFSVGEGLYTDMNAIRREEHTDNTHSLYVDQWDWEIVIDSQKRTRAFLIETVTSIYDVYRRTQAFIQAKYPQISGVLLPEHITFLEAQELEDAYPDLTPEQREKAACAEHKAIFIHHIGHALKSGQKHGDRSPDYDDWNLNGDIIFWNPILNDALEVSSMGIRVDAISLESQLIIANQLEKKELLYHKMIAASSLPLTIGGGIGQSRLCMFCLQKAHIGEVQVSVWDHETLALCQQKKVQLL